MRKKEVICTRPSPVFYWMSINPTFNGGQRLNGSLPNYSVEADGAGWQMWKILASGNLVEEGNWPVDIGHKGEYLSFLTISIFNPLLPHIYSAEIYIFHWRLAENWINMWLG
jgi:hypothetical protein